MAAKTAVFHQLASLAIAELFGRGYLLDDLDWDVQGEKYTLRIRGADRRPMTAVGLITFSVKSSKFIVMDAVTGEKSEFKLSEANGERTKGEFMEFICSWAETLREAAAYK